MLLMKIALKASDIGHTSKEGKLHLEWTKRVTNEFFNQGAKESELGLPISPYMNKSEINIPKSQIGFINFLVIPLFKEFAKQFPAVEFIAQQVESNFEFWKKREEEGKIDIQ